MEFLLLIYGDEKDYIGLPKEESEAVQKGGGGKTTTTDGPFAETKEQLGGYYLVDVPTIQDAIAVAAQIPGARDGSVEVRPIMKFS